MQEYVSRRSAAVLLEAYEARHYQVDQRVRHVPPPKDPPTRQRWRAVIGINGNEARTGALNRPRHEPPNDVHRRNMHTDMRGYIFTMGHCHTAAFEKGGRRGRGHFQRNLLQARQTSANQIGPRQGICQLRARLCLPTLEHPASRHRRTPATSQPS